MIRRDLRSQEPGPKWAQVSSWLANRSAGLGVLLLFAVSLAGPLPGFSASGAPQPLPRAPQANAEPEPDEGDDTGRRPTDPDNQSLPPEIREDVEQPPPPPPPEALDSQRQETQEEPAAEAPPVRTPPAVGQGGVVEKSESELQTGPSPALKETQVSGPTTEPKRRKGRRSQSTDKEVHGRRFEKEAEADAREMNKLNRQIEREAAERDRTTRKKKSRGSGSKEKNIVPDGSEERGARASLPSAPPAPSVPSGESSSAIARLRSWLTQQTSPSPIPLPVASPVGSPTPQPSSGKKGRRKGKQKPGGAPSTSASASASSGPAGAASSPSPSREPENRRSRRRKEDYSRVGGEAPLTVDSTDRTAVQAVTQTVAVCEPLKEVLHSIVDRPRVPFEQDIAVAYLGYLGDSSRLSILQKKIDDQTLDDSQKLPILATLVDSYGDVVHRESLYRIVDSPASASFQKLWALEILTRLADKTRIQALQKIVDDRQSDQSEQLRALAALADLQDDSRKDAARRLSNDSSLFLATRLQVLAILGRMQKDQGLPELKKHMNAHHISVEERLSIAFDLCLLGEESAAEFFERVVEREADTIFHQLRALHGLALMSRCEYLGVLAKIVQGGKKPSAVAARIMVMMGDRSRITDLLKAAREGDLDAIRTLVLAHVMDTQKLTSKELYRQPRLRSLVAP